MVLDQHLKERIQPLKPIRNRKMKISSTRCRIKGLTDPAMLYFPMLIFGAYSIPVFWHKGDFSFDPVSGGIYIFIVTGFLIFISSKYLLYCLSIGKVIIHYPLKIWNRRLEIPYHQIEFVLYEEEENRPATYETRNYFLIQMIGGLSVKLPVRKSLWRRRSKRLEKILDFFRESGVEVRVQ